jgi:hypothetical protein
MRSVCDPDQWSAFTRQWDTYRVIPTVLYSELPIDVMHGLFCDVALRGGDGVGFGGDHISAIKTCVVKDESALVHCVKINRMTQSPWRGIPTLLVRLHGQTAWCLPLQDQLKTTSSGVKLTPNSHWTFKTENWKKQSPSFPRRNGSNV